MSGSTPNTGLWQPLTWSLAAPVAGGVSRLGLLRRTVWALVRYPGALRQWLEVVNEQHGRGLMADPPVEFMRLLRPYVHRGVTIPQRAVQLIDHADWLETAIQPGPLAQLASTRRPVVLAELPPPRGFATMRLQLQRAPAASPEGELLAVLTLERDKSVPMAPPYDVATVAFSVFRLQGMLCLAIGGVRGQRHPTQRLSTQEVAQALHGWKAPVLMIRVMQELARHWGLHLIGLDPDWHLLRHWSRRFSTRASENALRIGQSLGALWTHFDAKNGPTGWVVLPPDSDDSLAATAQSPEKRARQIERADYWIRTGGLLRREFPKVLLRPHAQARDEGGGDGHTIQGGFSGYEDSRHASVLDSVPAALD